MNIAQAVSRFAVETPDAPALQSDRGALTYHRLEAAIRVFADDFAAQGVRKGDSVAIRVRNPFLHVAASLGLARLGVEQFGLSSDGVSNYELEVAAKLEISAVVIDAGTAPPGGLTPIFIESNWSRNPKSNDGRAAAASDDGNLPCLVGASSGTTGDPKVFRLTHRQLFARAEHAGAIGYGAGDRFLSLLDVAILMQKSLVHRVLIGGGTVLFHDSLGPEEIAAFCQRNRVSHIYAFPFMVDAMAPPRDLRAQYRDLKGFAMAGATVTEEALNRVVERITENVFVVYGTGEVGTVAYADLALRRRYPNAVGRPIEGVELSIVDEDGIDVPPGKIGQIQVRTPSMIDGYLGRSDLTALYFRDGWFFPRDLVSVTDDGILLFHGRADEMMIIDGLNIYPAQIEKALLQHPAVTEAAAFPMKSSIHQDVPAAVVVLGAPAEVAELRTYCEGQLGARAPRRIEIVEEFPRSATGKVLKAELARNILRRTAR